MNFKEKIAAYVINILTEKDIPEIGLTAIEENYSGEFLNIIAGLSKNESPFLKDEYFKKTLEELNIEIPTESEARNIIIDFFANEIINKNIDSYNGFKEIENAIGAEDIYDEKFDLSNSYEEFLIIWETETEGLEFYDKRKQTKEQFILVAKEELRQRLIERKKRKTPHNSR